MSILPCHLVDLLNNPNLRNKSSSYPPRHHKESVTRERGPNGPKRAVSSYQSACSYNSQLEFISLLIFHYRLSDYQYYICMPCPSYLVT